MKELPKWVPVIGSDDSPGSNEYSFKNTYMSVPHESEETHIPAISAYLKNKQLALDCEPGVPQQLHDDLLLSLDRQFRGTKCSARNAQDIKCTLIAMLMGLVESRCLELDIYTGKWRYNAVDGIRHILKEKNEQNYEIIE